MAGICRDVHIKFEPSRTNEQRYPPRCNNIIVTMNVCVDFSNIMNQNNESNKEMILRTKLIMEVAAAAGTAAASNEVHSTRNDDKIQPTSPSESDQQTNCFALSKKENNLSKAGMETEVFYRSDDDDDDDDGKAIATGVDDRNKIEKHVTFCPYVMTRTIPNRLLQKEILWYTDEEYETMIEQKRKLQNRLHSRQRQEMERCRQQKIEHFAGGDVDAFMRVKHFICCGLTTMKQETKRQKYKQKSIYAVLSDEFTQLVETGHCNPQRLARVYSKHSHVAQQEAYFRAKQVVLQLSSASMA